MYILRVRVGVKKTEQKIVQTDLKTVAKAVIKTGHKIETKALEIAKVSAGNRKPLSLISEGPWGALISLLLSDQSVKDFDIGYTRNRDLEKERKIYYS